MALNNSIGKLLATSQTYQGFSNGQWLRWASANDPAEVKTTDSTQLNLPSGPTNPAMDGIWVDMTLNGDILQRASIAYKHNNTFRIDYHPNNYINFRIDQQSNNLKIYLTAQVGIGTAPVSTNNYVIHVYERISGDISQDDLYKEAKKWLRQGRGIDFTYDDNHSLVSINAAHSPTAGGVVGQRIGFANITVPTSGNITSLGWTVDPGADRNYYVVRGTGNVELSYLPIQRTSAQNGFWVRVGVAGDQFNRAESFVAFGANKESVFRVGSTTIAASNEVMIAINNNVKNNPVDLNPYFQINATPVGRARNFVATNYLVEVFEARVIGEKGDPGSDASVNKNNVYDQAKNIIKAGRNISIHEDPHNAELTIDSTGGGGSGGTGDAMGALIASSTVFTSAIAGNILTWQLASNSIFGIKNSNKDIVVEEFLDDKSINGMWMESTVNGAVIQRLFIPYKPVSDFNMTYYNFGSTGAQMTIKIADELNSPNMLLTATAKQNWDTGNPFNRVQFKLYAAVSGKQGEKGDPGSDANVTADIIYPIVKDFFTAGSNVTIAKSDDTTKRITISSTGGGGGGFSGNGIEAKDLPVKTTADVSNDSLTILDKADSEKLKRTGFANLPYSTSSGGGSTPSTPVTPSTSVLTYSPIGEFDVAYLDNSFILKESASGRFDPTFQTQNTNTFKGGSATDGWLLRIDGGNNSPRIKAHKITGTGNNAVLSTSASNITVPSGFNLGSNNDWDVAVDEDIIAVAYSSDSGTTKVYFGSFDGSGASPSVTWKSTPIDLATSGFSSAASTNLCLGIANNTFVLIRTENTRSVLYSGTLTRSAQNTTISDFEAVDSNFNHHILALDMSGTDEITMVFDQFLTTIEGNRVFVGEYSGSGGDFQYDGLTTSFANSNDSTSAEKITLTNNTTYSFDNVWGLGIHRSTLFIDTKYDRTQGSSGDLRRKYVWPATITDVAVGRADWGTGTDVNIDFTPQLLTNGFGPVTTLDLNLRVKQIVGNKVIWNYDRSYDRTSLSSSSFTISEGKVVFEDIDGYRTSGNFVTELVAMNDSTVITCEESDINSGFKFYDYSINSNGSLNYSSSATTRIYTNSGGLLEDFNGVTLGGMWLNSNTLILHFNPTRPSDRYFVFCSVSGSGRNMQITAIKKIAIPSLGASLINWATDNFLYLSTTSSRVHGRRSSASIGDIDIYSIAGSGHNSNFEYIGKIDCQPIRDLGENDIYQSFFTPDDNEFYFLVNDGETLTRANTNVNMKGKVATLYEAGHLFNRFNATLGNTAPTGFSVVESYGFQTSETINSKPNRGYRIRAYKDAGATGRQDDTLVRTVYVPYDVRGNRADVYFGQAYHSDYYGIDLGDGLAVGFHNAIAVDRRTRVIFMRTFVGQIPDSFYFLIDGITGDAALPNSADGSLVNFEIDELPLSTTVADDDSVPFWNFADERQERILIADLKSLLVSLSGGITSTEARSIAGEEIQNDVSAWALIGDSTLIPKNKLTNSVAITNVSSSFESTIGKTIEKLYGDGATATKRLGFLKNQSQTIGHFIPHKISTSKVGVDGNQGYILPEVPRGFIELSSEVGQTKLVVAPANTEFEDRASYIVSFKKQNVASWTNITVTKASSGSGMVTFTSTTSANFEANVDYDLRIGTTSVSQLVNMFAANIISPLIDETDLNLKLADFDHKINNIVEGEEVIRVDSNDAISDQSSSTFPHITGQVLLIDTARWEAWKGRKVYLDGNSNNNYSIYARDIPAYSSTAAHVGEQIVFILSTNQTLNGVFTPNSGDIASKVVKDSKYFTLISDQRVTNRARIVVEGFTDLEFKDLSNIPASSTTQQLLTVTSNNLSAQAKIGNSFISDNAITTSNIVDKSVTAAKLADDVVGRSGQVITDATLSTIWIASPTINANDAFGNQIFRDLREMPRAFFIDLTNHLGDTVVRRAPASGVEEIWLVKPPTSGGGQRVTFYNYGSGSVVFYAVCRGRNTSSSAIAFRQRDAQDRLIEVGAGEYFDFVIDLANDALLDSSNAIPRFTFGNHGGRVNLSPSRRKISFIFAGDELKTGVRVQYYAPSSLAVTGGLNGSIAHIPQWIVE